MSPSSPRSAADYLGDAPVGRAPPPASWLPVLGAFGVATAAAYVVGRVSPAAISTDATAVLLVLALHVMLAVLVGWSLLRRTDESVHRAEGLLSRGEIEAAVEAARLGLGRAHLQADRARALDVLARAAEARRDFSAAAQLHAHALDALGARKMPGSRTLRAPLARVFAARRALCLVALDRLPEARALVGDPDVTNDAAGTALLHLAAALVRHRDGDAEATLAMLERAGATLELLALDERWLARLLRQASSPDAPVLPVPGGGVLDRLAPFAPSAVAAWRVR